MSSFSLLVGRACARILPVVAFAVAVAALAACAHTNAGAARPGTMPSSAAASASRPRVGRLAPSVIQHVVRASFPRIRACYEKGLARDAKLHGKAKVRFVIDQNGRVPSADDYGSTLPDADAVACILAVYRTLSFPAPDGGKVTVIYPINFDVGVAPGLGAAAAD